MADQPPVPDRSMAEAIALLKSQIARDEATIAELRAMVAFLRNMASAHAAEQGTPRPQRR